MTIPARGGAHRNGRFPTPALVLKEDEKSRGGRAAMAAFPLKRSSITTRWVVVHYMQHQSQKAFGKTDNVCNVLSGASWTPNGETRVLIAVKPI